MDTQSMTYFVRIAELKSISRAAASLFISQQALSKALARLEDELGTTLFIRSREGVTLTESGIQFLSFSLSSLRRYDTFRDQLGRLRHTEADAVRFSYACGLLVQLSPSFLTDFMSSHPDTEFYLRSHNDDKYNRVRLQDDYSVVLSSLELESDQYELVYSVESDLTILMARENPLALQDTVSWPDLKNTPFVHISIENKLSADIDYLLKINNITARYIINPMEFDILEYVCTRQNAVTIFSSNQKGCPDWAVLRRFENKGLAMRLCISVRRDVSLSQAELELIDLLKKELSANLG